MPKRYPPDDPREWLNRARSNLGQAKAKRKGIYLEDLCFHAQQATEKAIKALLIKFNVDFPYVHDLAELLTLVEKAGLAVPEFVRQAEDSVSLRFSPDTPVSHQLSRKENTKKLLKLRGRSSNGRKALSRPSGGNSHAC